MFRRGGGPILLPILIFDETLGSGTFSFFAIEKEANKR
jgi:hypothetical protein